MGSAFARAAIAWLAASAFACGGAGTSATGQGGTDGGESRPPDAAIAPEASVATDAAIDATTDASSLLDAGAPPADAAPLPALTIDLAQTSVSGLSSGAFMAVQFGVAFSSIVVGIGVFAGGPFGCSQGSATTAQLE